MCEAVASKAAIATSLARAFSGAADHRAKAAPNAKLPSRASVPPKRVSAVNPDNVSVVDPGPSVDSPSVLREYMDYRKVRTSFGF